MESKKTLYNLASVFAIGAFVSTLVDGVSSFRHKSPSFKITLMVTLALLATMMRTPLLLSNDATMRELFLFTGFSLTEGASLTLNLLAFAEARLTVAAAVVAVVTAVMFGLLLRKLWLVART
jgi:FtsH-binding integral membrane protein